MSIIQSSGEGKHPKPESNPYELLGIGWRRSTDCEVCDMMCSIKKCFLCTRCDSNQKCEEEREQFLSELCFKWWNFNELPPEDLRTEEVLSAMMEYMHSHPEKFRGARPQ